MICTLFLYHAIDIILGGLVTIIGSDGKPTQVPANTLPMPQSLSALSGASNTAALGSYTKCYYNVTVLIPA